MNAAPPPLRRKIAIANAVLGIPSEVWIARQARGFAAFEPILLGWERHPDADLSDASSDPASAEGSGPFSGPFSGLPSTLIHGPFPQPDTPLSRALRKIGRPEAYRITGPERRAIERALADTAPDLVLAHFGWTGIVLAQALPPDIPLVLHVHGRDVSALMELPAYRAALRHCLRRVAGLVAVGAHQLDRLAPLGLPDKVALIPCGAPLSLFASMPLPEQNGPLRFISVGRLSEEKGMRESLDAFARILPECPEAELVLVGYGPLFDPLQQEIAAKGLTGRVRLTGRLAPEEIARELAGSHVYLQHSRHFRGWIEGFGVTLTEAGAAGLPLLASASGGLMDQIEEGENGFLFPEGDVAAQADLMLRLARDADLRRRMGARARDLAGRFDSAVMTQKLEEFLLGLV